MLGKRSLKKRLKINKEGRKHKKTTVAKQQEKKSRSTRRKGLKGRRYRATVTLKSNKLK